MFFPRRSKWAQDFLFVCSYLFGCFKTTNAHGHFGQCQRRFCRRYFFLAKLHAADECAASSLKEGTRSPEIAAKCREPRENRGRLRHCIGLQASQSHCSFEWEGRSKDRSPEPGYRFSCARRDPPFTWLIDFSDKEKDEASASNCFRRGRNDFTPSFSFCRRMKVFCLGRTGAPPVPLGASPNDFFQTSQASHTPSSQHWSRKS